MKYLLALLILIPTLAHAGDMVELDYGVGQGTKPYYGADYEFVGKETFLSFSPYLDVALTGNQDYVQPYVSSGAQFEHLSFGLAAAVSMSNFSNGAFNGQLLFGPEIGYMQNLTDLVYVKENTSYLGFPGTTANLNFTFSIGFNL